MSTGDQSEYLRRKMAERRSNYEQGGQFMKSGYQKWAETERPARQGGASKEPMETMSMKAGKDILDRVKSLGEDMFAQYYKGSGRHIQGNESESDSDSDCGGAALMNVHEGTGAGYSGNGKLQEHAADLMKMAKKKSHKMPDGSMMAGLTHPKGKGKMECVHHEDGEGTLVRGGANKRLDEMKKARREAREAREAEAESPKEGAGKRKKRRGKGFKEGVDASVKTVGHVGEVAKAGFDAYEKGASGDLFGAIDATKGILSQGMMAKSAAEKAAEEFRKVGGMRATKDRMELEKSLKEGKPVDMSGNGRSARAAIVKKVMKEKGLSLPAASKYVKEHGLYKK